MSALISTERDDDQIQTYILPLIEGRVVTQYGEIPAGDIPTAENIESLIAQSKAEGFAVGHAEGLAQAERDLEHCSQIVEHINQEFATPLNDLDEEVAQAVAELIGLAAKHIVHRQLVVEPAEIVGIVQDAITQLPIAEREICIFSSPRTT